MAKPKPQNPAAKSADMRFFRPDYNDFLACSEELSLSKAAETLGKRQSALSKVVKKLESELGYTVFVRTNSGIRLTDRGAELRQGLLRLREASAEIFESDRKDDEPSGELSIGCHNSLAIWALPKILPVIMREFPLLSPVTSLERSTVILDKVASHELDLGLVAGHVKTQGLISRLIKTESVAGFSKAPKHDRVLVYNPDTIMKSSMLAKFGSYKKIAIRDYEVIASVAAESGFLGLMPESVGTRYRLRQATPALLTAEISIVYRKEKLNSSGKKIVLDRIVESVSSKIS